MQWTIGDYEVSVTTILTRGSLCVYRGSENVTKQVFGEDFPEVLPTPDNVIVALQWCQDRLPENQARLELESEISRKVSLFSDYHKDFYGYRPNTTGWSREKIVEAYDQLQTEREAMTKTLEGRSELRRNCWWFEDAVNFSDFCTKFAELHSDHASPGFLREQFDLLEAGVRDARIHDTAFNAYRGIGLGGVA